MGDVCKLILGLKLFEKYIDEMLDLIYDYQCVIDFNDCDFRKSVRKLSQSFTKEYLEFYSKYVPKSKMRFPVR